jgi:hypothetical protein
MFTPLNLLLSVNYFNMECYKGVILPRSLSVRCKMWPRHAVTSYHVIHAAHGDDATVLRVRMYVCTYHHIILHNQNPQQTDRSHTRESALRASIVSSIRLKTLKRERRRSYNIPCFSVLSRRLETMEARSADSRVFFFFRLRNRQKLVRIRLGCVLDSRIYGTCCIISVVGLC